MSNGRLILERHRRVWAQKPVLRAIYHDWYRQMLAGLTSSKHPTIEIGAGPGNLKEFHPQAIATDCIACDWLDLVCDGHSLPFKADHVGNLLLFDALHHLTNPARFFQEAQRILEPNGRIIMLEPYLSPFSWLCYSVFHQERVSRGINPMGGSPLSSPTAPFDGNSAIPTLIFGRHKNEFRQQFPDLQIVIFRRMSFLAYPLSGGFKDWSLLPLRWVPLVNQIESGLAFLLPFMAFRCLIVLEKTSPFPSGPHREPSDEATRVQSVPLK